MQTRPVLRAPFPRTTARLWKRHRLKIFGLEGFGVCARYLNMVPQPFNVNNFAIFAVQCLAAFTRQALNPDPVTHAQNRTRVQKLRSCAHTGRRRRHLLNHRQLWRSTTEVRGNCGCDCACAGTTHASGAELAPLFGQCVVVKCARVAKALTSTCLASAVAGDCGQLLAAGQLTGGLTTGLGSQDTTSNQPKANKNHDTSKDHHVHPVWQIFRSSAFSVTRYTSVAPVARTSVIQLRSVFP